MKYIELLEGIKKHGIELYAYAVVVAEAYYAAPDKTKEALLSFESLLKSNDRLFKQVSKMIDIEFTPDDPYGKETEVARDVVDNNRLKVYTGDSDHPIFTPHQNAILRTIHDYYTHTAKNRKADISGDTFLTHGFNLRGELNAYLTHAKLAPKDAIPALFTEIVGQISYVTVTGEFPKQKATILKGFDYINLGDMDPKNQARFDEILSQLTDPNVDKIQTKIGGYVIDKSAINPSKVSRSGEKTGKLT